MAKILFSLLIFAMICPSSVKAKTKYTAIDAEYETPTHLSPGDNIAFALFLVKKKNKKVLISDKKYDLLKVVTDGCEFQNGILIVNNNEKTIHHHTVTVLFMLAEDTSVNKKIVFKLDYCTTQHCYDCQGATGTAGLQGKDRGTPLIGCEGTNGNDGQPALNGANCTGGHVFLQLVYDSSLKTSMLHIAVKCEGSAAMQYYLVNPNGGKLLVSGRGGQGGQGGPGGNGGDGKDAQLQAGLLKVDRDGCQGGNGGNGGNGGDGGNSGTLVIRFDPSAEAYSSCIIADVSGGPGGPGGQGGIGGQGGQGLTTTGVTKYDLAIGEEWKLKPGFRGENGHTGQPGKAGVEGLVRKEYGTVTIPWW